MDEIMNQMLDLASRRGNQYVKGEASLSELPEKMAELGVMLLEKSGKLGSIQGSRLREELIEIQNKTDDLRRCIFSCKGKIK